MPLLSREASDTLRRAFEPGRLLASLGVEAVFTWPPVLPAAPKKDAPVKEIRELDDLDLERVAAGKQVALPIIGGLAWWAIQRWLAGGPKKGGRR